MVERSRTVWKLKRGIYEATEWGEVEVSDNDTIVFDCLSDSESPYNAVLWKMTDGTVVTLLAFGGDNEVEIDDVTASDTQCIYMVYGVKG